MRIVDQDYVITHHQLAWLLYCANAFAMSSDPDTNILMAIKHANECTFENFPRPVTLRWQLKKDNLSIKRRTYSITWRNTDHRVNNPVGIVCMGYLLVCAAQMPKMQWHIGTNYGCTVRATFLAMVMDAFKGNK